MQLIAAFCSHYRRFADETTMDLNPKVVCIVGPNEAGKSSFLTALTHLNSPDFTAAERTRGQQAEPGVGARFLIDNEDRNVLADIPEARNARHYIWQAGAGRHQYSFEPQVKRDRSGRREVVERLRKLADGRWLDGVPAAAEDEQPATSD
jgi:ATPase subunit of ABC transporter with duplicated ATPase domains